MQLGSTELATNLGQEVGPAIITCSFLNLKTNFTHYIYQSGFHLVSLLHGFCLSTQNLGTLSLH
jgi:hypothetical protein